MDMLELEKTNNLSLEEMKKEESPKSKRVRRPPEPMGPGMLRPRERDVLEALSKVHHISDVPEVLRRKYPDITEDQVYGIKSRVVRRVFEAYKLIGFVNNLRSRSKSMEKWLTPRAPVELKVRDPTVKEE